MSESEKRMFLSPHTDLAVEAHQHASRRGKDIKGVRIERGQFEGGHITRVIVENELGTMRIGKPPGSYITIEASGLRQHDPELREHAGQALAEELIKLLPERKAGANTLVVGLGNWNVTPDALGPRVVEELLVTRHLFEFAPEHVATGMGSVCAIAPGVLGITGIETGEIIQGIVEKVKPDAVIAVDALAAGSVDRLSTTIQLADTGIRPGSGLGTKRRPLTKETLGVPVIAVGVPTVVFAQTIALTAINHVVDAWKAASQESGLSAGLTALSDQEQAQLVQEVLGPYFGDMVVTPKEIDEQIRQISKVIAGGLNVALQPGLAMGDILTYLQ